MRSAHGALLLLPGMCGLVKLPCRYLAGEALHVIATGLAVTMWCDCHTIVCSGRRMRDTRQCPLLGR